MLRDVLYYAQLLLEATLGVFGLRIYEEPRHHVVATLGDGVEIRRYAPRLAAETEVAGDDAEARSSAFRILFAYTAGANAEAEKIAMTAPVETAPGADGVRMRFFLPALYTAATAPRPTDARVHLIPVPEETMAVLRFSGRGTEAELARRTEAAVRVERSGEAGS